MGNNIVSVASTTKLGGNVVFTVLMILATVAVLLTAVWLIVRFLGYEKGRKLGKVAAIVIAVGAVVRILCAVFIGGYRNDMNVYNEMLDYFLKNGVSGYYKTSGVAVFPLTFYFTALFGGLGRILGFTAGSSVMALMIKFSFIIADVVTATLLYKIAKRYVNSEVAVVIAGVFSLCPVFFLSSGAWGTELSLAAPFVVGSMYALIDKKPFFAMLWFALATLVTKACVYLFPLYIVYYGFKFFASLVANVKLTEKKAFAERLNDGALSLAFKLPVFFIATYLIKYLVALPLMIGTVGASPFKMTLLLTLKPLVSNAHFSYNGLSIFNIFGKNAVAVGNAFPQVVFVVCFGVLIAAIVGLVYFSKRNRAVFPLIAAYISFTLTTYFVGASAVGTLLSIVLLLMSFIYVKDVRIIRVLSVSSVLYVIITLTVMTSAGYLNAYGSASFGATYAGSAVLSDRFGFVVLIFTSIVSILNHVYLTLVTFDISMSNNRKLLSANPQAKYFDGIKKLFK